MKDDEKTKEQLLIELKELRLQNAALEKSITAGKAAGLVFQESTHYAESIVETVRDPLLVMDENLKIILANRSFYKTFQVTPGETIGSFIYDLGNKQWDIPKLRDLLENILPQKEEFNDFEVEHTFENIGHKVILLNARQIYRQDIESKLILLSIEDITLKKQLENLLKHSENRFRRLFETSNDGILLLEKGEGKIAHVNPATEKMLGYTEGEIIGQMLENIGVKLNIGDIKTILQTLDKEGIIHCNSIQIEKKSGQILDADIHLIDKTSLIQCNIRDITERRQKEDEIRKINEGMEQTINEQTKDLRKNIDYLEELTRAFVGRELKMIELKEQIAELEKKKP